MRLILIIKAILLVIHVNLGVAETADQVFKNFREAYNKSKNFSAKFEETTIRNGKKNIARGSLSIAKPNLLRQEYHHLNADKKIAQLLLIDGEYVWSYTPILNQVNKTKFDRKMRNKLLPMDMESLDRMRSEHHLEVVEDAVAKKKGVHRLRFKPKSKAIYDWIEIWIDSKNWLPVQFGYRSVSGKSSTIDVTVSLREILWDQKFPENQFKFIKSEEMEIIDLSPEAEK